MFLIILITIAICVVAFKASKAEEKDITDEMAERILETRQRVAIARCQMAEERQLKYRRQMAIKRAVQERCPERKLYPKGEAKASIMPEPIKRVPAPTPVPCGNKPADSSHNGDNIDVDEEVYENFFSPSVWWNENYTKLVQESEDTFRLSKNDLPKDRSEWANIGKYLLENEDFTDFSVGEDSIILKCNYNF